MPHIADDIASKVALILDYLKAEFDDREPTLAGRRDNRDYEFTVLAGEIVYRLIVARPLLEDRNNTPPSIRNRLVRENLGERLQRAVDHTVFWGS